MDNMKKIIPILAFMLALYLIIFSGYFDKEWNDRCCLFYKAELSGVVEYCSSGTAGNVLKIKGGDIKYNFVDSINHYRDPSYLELVSVGDSVSKIKYGDFLIVKKFTSQEVVKIPLKNCCFKNN